MRFAAGAAMRPGQGFKAVRSVKNRAQCMHHRMREQLVDEATFA